MLFVIWATCLLISLALAKASSGCCQTDHSFYQLESFKNSTCGPIGIMTTTYGAPVSTKEAENSLDMELLDNVHLLEEITSFNRQKIVERIVHAKGAGAHGYFEVTHDVTDVTNAALFSKISKITPVSARFSPATSNRGAFSFSAKFYTEEGNWDFVGINTDVMFVKDSVFFASMMHANFENPKTFIIDQNSVFDTFLARPESINFLLLVFGDPGAPGSYRHMPSHTIHTFQVENDKGVMSMIRFHMLPDLGVQYLNQSEVNRLAGIYPDHYNQDLYDTIACGDHPSWTLYMQVISEAEIKTADIDIYDVTMRWPLHKWPLRPIGKLVVNKNPDNYFAEVEQLAFNPGNLPPGIQGVDRMLKIRTLAYRDAHHYRLGANFNKIKVNCPVSPVYTYTRDGQGPVGDNSGGIPNYYPNTFNGPVPAKKTRTKTKKVQPKTVPEATNMDQAREYYKCLSDAGKARLASNVVTFLKMTYPYIQQRAIALFSQVDSQLAADLSAGLTAAAAAGLPPKASRFIPDYTCPGTSAPCNV